MLEDTHMGERCLFCGHLAASGTLAGFRVENPERIPRNLNGRLFAFVCPDCEEHADLAGLVRHTTPGYIVPQGRKMHERYAYIRNPWAADLALLAD